MVLGQHAKQLMASLSTTSVFIVNLAHKLSYVIVTFSITQELVIYFRAFQGVVLDGYQVVDDVIGWCV